MAWEVVPLKEPMTMDGLVQVHHLRLEQAGDLREAYQFDIRVYPRAMPRVRALFWNHLIDSWPSTAEWPLELLPFVMKFLREVVPDWVPAAKLGLVFGVSEAQHPDAWERGERTALDEPPVEQRDPLEGRVRIVLGRGVPLGHYFLDGEWLTPQSERWAWATYRDIAENHPTSLTPGERVWRQLDRPESVLNNAAQQARLTHAILNVILPGGDGIYDGTG